MGELPDDLTVLRRQIDDLDDRRGLAQGIPSREDAALRKLTIRVENLERIILMIAGRFSDDSDRMAIENAISLQEETPMTEDR